MGMMKNYLLKLLEQCSVEQFGQDAIEWALVTGLVHLSYDSDQDVHSIMLRYADIIDGYRQSLAQPKQEQRTLPMKRAGHRRKVKSERSDSRGRENAA
jgi:hypothetical protein